MLHDAPLKSGDRIYRLDKFPKDAHFAALLEDSHSYDDGYGGRDTAHTLTYHYLGNKEQANKWVEEQDASMLKWGSPKKFQLIQVQPCAVQRSVNISITGDV